MLTDLEISLQQALQDYGLRELPAELGSESKKQMIDGIALVTKIGGIQNYCKVARDSDGKLSVKKDYGKSLRIISIDKVYPVNMLEKRFKPNLHTDEEIKTFLRFTKHDKAEIERLLSTEGKTEEQIKQDRATVEGYVNETSLASAKETLKEEERCKEIKEYSKRIKTKKDEQPRKKNTRTKKTDN